MIHCHHWHVGTCLGLTSEPAKAANMLAAAVCAPCTPLSAASHYTTCHAKSVKCCRYLLPPIIFYAGISVKKKQFFRNFASIAIFGVLGTYIAFAVIACVLYGFSKLPNVLNFSVGSVASLSDVVYCQSHLLICTLAKDT